MQLAKTRAMKWKMPAMAAALVAMLASSAGAVSAAAADRDDDGISDQAEEALGTDPAQPERLRTVIDDGPEDASRRQKPTYDSTKDFTKVEFCHVAEDRYLWRVTLAARPRPNDTVLHLYVDADANAETGRKGTRGAAYIGTEYMLSVVAGRGTCSQFAADGERLAGPVVSFAVQDNAVLISADVKLARNEQGVRYALYVLCHTTTRRGERARMSDNSRKRIVTAPLVADRKKIVRPRDYRSSHNVSGTFHLPTIRKILAAETTVVVRHDQLHTDGFEVDQFTSRRWPHLKRTKARARAWTKAPKAGAYHVGFMMYDTHGRCERVVIRIDGERAGVAVANADNNRTWLYWLDNARAFKDGERVELLTAGQGGTHGICNVLFLPRPPQASEVEYGIDNLVAARDFEDAKRLIVSWTCSWPCPTAFEYGRDGKYGRKVGDAAAAASLVHRVVLDGLEPGIEYHGRAVGETRDGKAYYSDDFSFRLAPAAPPPTKKGITAVALTVRNPHSFALKGWPVTTGVPFPRGALAGAERVRLCRGESEVPAQFGVTGRWPDGSVRWLLLTFAADAPAGGSAPYRLEFGRDVRRRRLAEGVSVTSSPQEARVGAGVLRVRIDRKRRLVALGGGDSEVLLATCTTEAEDAQGRKYDGSAADAKITVEEAGPVRAVIKRVALQKADKGARVLRIEERIEAYRNLPILRVRHTFSLAGPGEFTDLAGLRYRVSLGKSRSRWDVPLAGGGAITLDARTKSVQQRFDDEFVLRSPKGSTSRKGRIRGALIAAGEVGFAVAVRDFWQNYPKAFGVDGGGVRIGLCPAFEGGVYDKFPFEREGHHLYYYLRGGKYRFKHGMAKTHEVLLSFAPAKEQASICAAFQRPPLAIVSPEWIARCKVFGDIHPRDAKRFGLYEKGVDRNLKAYAGRREKQRDYGLMNYGDWYGERGSNWGNIEYDTQFAFFLEYVRSGDPRAFFLGEAAELHNRDVDTVHAGADNTRNGGVYIHQMGHVGGYYDKSVPGTLGFPKAGFTVSHAWVEGHFAHYFLTGDRRSYETGRAVADYFTRRQLGRPYDFLTTRVPGWHLIMLTAAYRATNDPYYLNAARVVVERVLETQDGRRPLPAYQAKGRKPYQEGGWSRMMRPGHCRCTPRHRGNAGFMVAVLLSGLKYYHDLTGDERVKRAIIRGAHYLLDETYSDDVKGFRYTSCPKTRYSPGATPLMTEGVARAYLWTKDDRFRRVLTESLPLRAHGSSYGKGFSMYYRCGPRVLADLAAAGIELNEKAGNSR